MSQSIFLLLLFDKNSPNIFCCLIVCSFVWLLSCRKMAYNSFICATQWHIPAQKQVDMCHYMAFIIKSSI